MSDVIWQFKTSCNLAGHTLNCPNGRVQREFGLGDFLDNSLQDTDDYHTVAIKAIRFFCEEALPTQPVFRFGVLAVCEFLHRFLLKKTGPFSPNPLPIWWLF
jgi:hypothetical protein